jgi:hypothetical protein
MSRSGYDDGCDDSWSLIRWRGAVASALRGKRGQEFLKEMLAALDALPEHKLIREDLAVGDAVCAIGAVGKARGIDMSNIDPEDRESVGAAFGISPAMAAEIVYMNDDWWNARKESPEDRFTRMRGWVAGQIIEWQKEA